MEKLTVAGPLLWRPVLLFTLPCWQEDCRQRATSVPEAGQISRACANTSLIFPPLITIGISREGEADVGYCSELELIANMAVGEALELPPVYPLLPHLPAPRPEPKHAPGGREPTEKDQSKR